jgi:4-amino-4-deoxy-L-arabinose transferase-like glycosyltransferase
MSLSREPFVSSQTVRGAGRSLDAVLRAWPFTALALLLGALYLPWIAAIPLDGTLEANRLEAAREMLHSGDWLIPHLGGEVYLSKPPLHPWTLALVSWFFGDVSVAIGRSVSALATLATAWLVFAWGRRELGTRSGAFAALALGSSVLCAEKAVRAELESELLFFTTLALLALFEAGWSDAVWRARGLRFVSGLALGAAVLVKGPPALIVFLVAAIAAGIPRERRRAFALSSAVALGLGLVCALAWVVPVCARMGFDSAWAAFHQQFVERIAHAGPTNAEAFWFYAPAILVALLPATLFVPGLCLVRPRLVRPGRVVEGARARSRAAFLWGWALLPLIAFSVSAGKETRYLLPTLPAWTLLLAWGWTRARVSRRFSRWHGGLERFLAYATWVAPVVWWVAGWRLFPEQRAVVSASAVGALLARATFAWSAQAARPAVLLGALVIAILSAKLGWSGTVLAKQRGKTPVAEVGGAIEARLGPEETWILVGPYRSWWQFSVNRPCRVAADWSELARACEAGTDARFALAPTDSIPPGDGGLERVDSWTVDGEPYSLVRLRP